MAENYTFHQKILIIILLFSYLFVLINSEHKKAVCERSHSSGGLMCVKRKGFYTLLEGRYVSVIIILI